MAKFQLTINLPDLASLGDLLDMLESAGLDAETATSPLSARGEDTPAATLPGVATPPTASAAEPAKRAGRPRKEAAPAAEPAPPPATIPGVPAAAPSPVPGVPAAAPAPPPPAAVASAPVEVMLPPPQYDVANPAGAIATPPAPTEDDMKTAMGIAMGRFPPEVVQAILHTYTGHKAFKTLMGEEPAWAPIGHYVLANYPYIASSVQARAK